jgi:F-box and WD-40 domain protein CDC4
MGTTSLSQNMPLDASPSPFASTHVHVHTTPESGRPKSRQTVALGWVEDEDAVSRQTSRLQIDLTDCVETKTVTTTTTTKRSYPPLVIPQKSLQELDPKEYPLASKRCPPDLINVSYGIDRLSPSRVGHLAEVCGPLITSV